MNEEVLGGLRSALERGQTLERAMMTLFNSGYKKEEIEEAARSLLEFQPSAQLQPPVKTVAKIPIVKQTPQPASLPKQQITPPQPTQIQKQSLQKQIPSVIQKSQVIQKPQIQQTIQVQKPIQKISNYGEEKPKEEKRPARERAIIFILVFLMAFLLGLLAVIFLFKDQLIAYFSNFFG